MANSAQAKKRARQSIVRRARNMSKRSHMRTYIKKLRKAIIDNNVDLVKALQPVTFSAIDKMVSKKIIHKNTAARYKSRINMRVKALVSAA